MTAVIGLLHPGEMGAAVGAALRRAGHSVLWGSAGRSATSAARAESAGLTDAGTVAELARRSDVVMSICPPHGAEETVRAVADAGFRGVYVDANAVSPATTRRIGAVIDAAGGTFVDGGIIGGPPTREKGPALYLAGPEAHAVAELFKDTTVRASVVSDSVGAASALKMAYAAWTKGTAALLLAIREVARREGVDEALLAEWARSQPSLPDRSAGAERSAASKGWRWIAEMEEIAATFGAAGQPTGFHEAAAEVYRRATE